MHPRGAGVATSVNRFSWASSAYCWPESTCICHSFAASTANTPVESPARARNRRVMESAGLSVVSRPPTRSSSAVGAASGSSMTLVPTPNVLTCRTSSTVPERTPCFSAQRR